MGNKSARAKTRGKPVEADERTPAQASRGTSGLRVARAIVILNVLHPNRSCTEESEKAATFQSVFGVERGCAGPIHVRQFVDEGGSDGPASAAELGRGNGDLFSAHGVGHAAVGAGRIEADKDGGVVNHLVEGSATREGRKTGIAGLHAADVVFEDE